MCDLSTIQDYGGYWKHHRICIILSYIYVCVCVIYVTTEDATALSVLLRLLFAVLVLGGGEVNVYGATVKCKNAIDSLLYYISLGVKEIGLLLMRV